MRVGPVADDCQFVDALNTAKRCSRVDTVTAVIKPLAAVKDKVSEIDFRQMSESYKALARHSIGHGTLFETAIP